MKSNTEPAQADAPSSNSLVRFLLTRILALVVPIVVASMAVHWYFQSALLARQFDEALVERAMTLATLVVREGGGLALEFADEFMPQYSRAEQPYYFQIWSANGESLERSYSLKDETLPLRRGSPDAPAAFETTLSSGAVLRCIGIEFPARFSSAPQASPIPPVVIVLGTGAEELHAALRRGYLEVALTGILSVCGILVLVSWTLRRGSRLLRRVVEQVEALEPDALEHPLELGRVPDEIRPIVAALDNARSTIHGYVERERRFNADVAHELRTPIAELRAAADIALRWPDEESRQRLAVDARDIALQMGALVESLLQLATLESEAAQAPFERLELCELVTRVAEQAQSGDSASKRIELQLPPSLWIRSRAQLWEVAVRNLLDNALSYSPADAEVRVALALDDGGARLCVSNPTQSIDQAGVLRCTERLWRADPGVQDAQHFGLGLSIVQAACAKLGQRFSVSLENGVFRALIYKSDVAPENHT